MTARPTRSPVRSTATTKSPSTASKVAVQYTFSKLPGFWSGFGVLANYTYQKDKGFTQTNVIDGSPLTFPGLSRNSYNASLYYENERFSARASYNWRDQWLITASGRGSLPEFNREYGQLDASLGFNVTEDVIAVPRRHQPDQRGAGAGECAAATHPVRNFRPALLLRSPRQVLKRDLR